MSTAAAPAPTDNAAPDAAAAAAAAAPQDDGYNFAEALDQVLSKNNNDPKAALNAEPGVKPDAAAEKAASEKAAAEKAAAEKAASDKAAAEKAEADKKGAPTPEDSDTSDALLKSFMNGEEVTEDALKKPAKPGDAPTDPNSREWKTWADLRSNYDLKSKENEDLKRQLAEANGKIPKDYDDIKKQLAERDAHIAKWDLSRRPAFQQQIAEPIRKIEGEFDKLAERLKVSKAMLREAVSITDEAEREAAINRVLTENEGTVPVTTLTQAVIHANNYHELRSAEAQYLEHAPQMLEQMDKEENEAKAQQAAKDKEEFGRSASVALQLVERTMPFLKDKDGNVSPELIKQLREATEKDFNSFKPGVRAFMLMAPSIIQEAVKAMKVHGDEKKALNDEIAKLKLQLSKYAGSSPSTTPGTSTTTETKTTSNDPWENYSPLQLSQLPVK